MCLSWPNSQEDYQWVMKCFCFGLPPLKYEYFMYQIIFACVKLQCLVWNALVFELGFWHNKNSKYQAQQQNKVLILIWSTGNFQGITHLDSQINQMSMETLIYQNVYRNKFSISIVTQLQWPGKSSVTWDNVNYIQILFRREKSWLSRN